MRHSASGDLFGLIQNAGMGWDSAEATRTPYLVLSTHGGLRGEYGRPIALGYHTGHWEVAVLVRAAAEAIQEAGGLPFAAYCTASRRSRTACASSTTTTARSGRSSPSCSRRARPPQPDPVALPHGVRG